MSSLTPVGLFRRGSFFWVLPFGGGCAWKSEKVFGEQAEVGPQVQPSVVEDEGSQPGVAHAGRYQVVRCFHPQPAVRTDGGDVTFVPRGWDGRREIELPCGQCIGCRLKRSLEWATRCMHEAQLHERNCFVTLTYDDAHVPSNYSLRYRDYQLFFKRLRKRVGRVRFYMCGEYGERTLRPHFHAALFGYKPFDLVFHKRLSSGHDLYTSEELSSFWVAGRKDPRPSGTLGFTSVGELSFESAAYIARYVTKKVTGSEAGEHYRRTDFETGEVFSVLPEFTRMSLKPGIGFDWFVRFRASNYRDFNVVNGRKMKPPRYYDKLLSELVDSRVASDVEFERYEKALKAAVDSTPQRLRDQEIVTRARLRFKVRTLE